MVRIGRVASRFGAPPACELLTVAGDQRPTPAPHLAHQRLKRHIALTVLTAVLLVGLDSSQPAGAVVTEAPRPYHPQLISLGAVASKSGLAINRLIVPDNHANEHVPMALELTVESGDTLIELLAQAGVVMSDAYAAVRALGPVFRARDVKPGWTLHVTVQPQDPPRLATLQTIAFQPSVEREIKVTRRDTDNGDPFLAVTIPHALHRISNLTRGTIDNGLFNAATAAGVPHELLVEAIALFSFEVDFQRDIRAGDQFELLYDTYNDDKGEFGKAGEIYYAKLVLRGKAMQYYRFTPHSGAADLFSPDGHSIRKALLQTPVDATRISSTYGMRRHPILGYTRMHRGVDFAAPAGTPVRAAGDGVVQVAGDGGSYGNYIRIQHNSKYSTAYAHLTGFARGVAKGVHVHQGEVIAYVGATGRATGPHLHYEVMVGGQQVNPRGVRLPAGETLTGDDLSAFKQRLQEVEAMRMAQQLDGATVASSRGAGCAASETPQLTAVSVNSGGC
jgi:murein DD-endopeptidase MepM/ murein hydrolase activator NlpD